MAVAAASHPARPLLAALLVVALVAPGCAAVRGRRKPPPPSGFLGDYSQLAKREGYPAQEVYLAPDVDWSRYRAVEIDSVTLWGNAEEGGKLSADEKKMLTDLLYQALHDELSKRFDVVQEPGPDTIRIRAALTQAKGANVPLRTITTLVPQVLLIGTAVGLSADTAATVGTATVEAELVDAVSGRRLAAAVDERAGTKSLFTGRTFQKWGDVQAAAHYWAGRLVAFLVRQGVQTKTP